MVDYFQGASIDLSHLLMMTSALDTTSRANLGSHQRKHSFLSPNLFIFEFFDVDFDKFDVFNGFIEVPHSEFLIAFFLVAHPHCFVFLLADSQE